MSRASVWQDPARLHQAAVIFRRALAREVAPDHGSDSAVVDTEPERQAS